MARPSVPGLALLAALLAASSPACDGAPDAPLPPLVSEGSRLEELPAWPGGLTAPEERVAPAQPEDVLSLLFVAEADGGARLAFSVFDDRGRQLVAPAASAFSPNRALPGRGLALALLPAASASLPLRPSYLVGAVSLEEEGGAAAIRVTGLVKRGPTPGRVPAAQTLLLTPVLVGDVAVPPGALEDRLAVAARIWRAAGVGLEVQAPVRIEGQEAAGLARVEIDPALGSDSPALGRLLSLTGRLPASAGLPLVVVRELVGSGGLALWAVAGGIPAAPTAGTARSGIAVGLETLAAPAARAGQILAHEIGHALGLFHTTEARLAGGPSGPIHDPIADSPECGAAADRAPADGTLSEEECAGAGAENLMFWAPSARATALTAEQGEIARRSPLSR